MMYAISNRLSIGEIIDRYEPTRYGTHRAVILPFLLINPQDCPELQAASESTKSTLVNI